jgi:hypothetical protein
MIKNTILTLLILPIIWSCSNSPKIDKGDSKQLFSEVYNDDNLESQTFIINNSIDNIIEGENGTKFRISKNTFIDEQGNFVKGEVKIELKEALTSMDMVMGNLTTTFNGKPLQSGGMIYLNATSKGDQLKISNTKAILVSVPADSLFEDMSIFEGNRDSLNNMKWSNPKPINLPKSEADSLPIESIVSFEKSHNIRYSVDGFNEPLDYPQEIQDKVGDIAWEGAGLKIAKDSTLKIGKYTVRFYKQNKLTKWSEVFTVEKGSNSYVTDQNIYYIFKIKKLGWANIDRLYSDPRTEKVDLVVDIKNNSEFNFIYTTMITQGMYLPGYQKKDGSYSFTHGDEESTELPIGEKVTIIATACKDNKTYFGYQTIKIKKKQDVKIELLFTSKKRIEETLKKEI